MSDELSQLTQEFPNEIAGLERMLCSVNCVDVKKLQIAYRTALEQWKGSLNLLECKNDDINTYKTERSDPTVEFLNMEYDLGETKRLLEASEKRKEFLKEKMQQLYDDNLDIRTQVYDLQKRNEVLTEISEILNSLKSHMGV